MGLNFGLRVRKQIEASGWGDDAPGCNPRGTQQEIEDRFCLYMHQHAQVVVALSAVVSSDSYWFDCSPVNYGAGIIQDDWKEVILHAMFGFVLEEFSIQCLVVESYFSV